MSTLRPHWHGMAAAVLMFVVAGTPPAASDSNGVPQGRLERLSSGVNITQWFRTFSPQPPEHYQSYMSDDEMQAIRAMGFRHVRLCIAPDYVYDPSSPGKLITANVAVLEEAIGRFVKHDLAVLVDPHNENQARIQDNAAWSGGYPEFWGALAARLKRFDPEMVYFEVVNEPDFNGREAEWFALQDRIIAAIRKSAPRHTIMATGTNWGGIDGLLKLKPLAERNIVYSFHFYDPFPFTHQGATWSSRFLPFLSSVPYPSSPALIQDALAHTTDPEAMRNLTAYGDQRWDREKLKARLAKAIDWSKQNSVPLYCGEFGVYSKSAPAKSRAAWFRDFTGVLGESGAGYAVWGWDDSFGFQRRVASGKVVIDPVPAEALGKKIPASLGTLPQQSESPPE